ncbi:hypothetical protein EVAR_66151_1 [Eumeta japonica]|uniref:Uncharacterized protein n=1 Tax=Eumeta variegata TaxID=151549 RepID=A0A4C1YZB9_EUMVA|nr:hypothetical protein EVAR_66151_1 [Eumeta japonica]
MVMCWSLTLLMRTSMGGVQKNRSEFPLEQFAIETKSNLSKKRQTKLAPRSRNGTTDKRLRPERSGPAAGPPGRALNRLWYFVLSTSVSIASLFGAFYKPLAEETHQYIMWDFHAVSDVDVGFESCGVAAGAIRPAEVAALRRRTVLPRQKKNDTDY